MRQSPKRNSNAAKPFGLRLTDQERVELTRRAGEMALGTYIKGVLFSDGAQRKKHGARSPVKDHAKLAEILACLGRSGLADSIRVLSEAAQSGHLYIDDTSSHTLQSACDDIAVMRLLLLQSLGFRVDTPDQDQSVSQTFARAAKDLEDRS